MNREAYYAIIHAGRQAGLGAKAALNAAANGTRPRTGEAGERFALAVKGVNTDGMHAKDVHIAVAATPG